MIAGTIVINGCRYAVLKDDGGNVIEQAPCGWPVDLDDGDAAAESHDMLVRHHYLEAKAAKRKLDESMQSAGL